MSFTRKAINFDLSTNELKKHFNNTAEAYSKIKQFMLQNGFDLNLQNKKRVKNECR